jgi:hypothetical protein
MLEHRRTRSAGSVAAMAPADCTRRAAEAAAPSHILRRRRVDANRAA